MDEVIRIISSLHSILKPIFCIKLFGQVHS